MGLCGDLWGGEGIPSMQTVLSSEVVTPAWSGSFRHIKKNILSPSAGNKMEFNWPVVKGLSILKMLKL